jgi:hypothetical protein
MATIMMLTAMLIMFCLHRYVWLIRGLENGGERMYQFYCALGRFEQV